MGLPEPSRCLHDLRRRERPRIHFDNERVPLDRLAAFPPTIRQAPIIGKLTTHVLDTAHGCPAAGMVVTLLRLDDHVATIRTLVLDADGRAPTPLLAGDEIAKGRYRLVFAVGDYFVTCGLTLPDPPFLDEVPVDFAIADPDANYHVPLLVSPWSYSTYRGS